MKKLFLYTLFFIFILFLIFSINIFSQSIVPNKVLEDTELEAQTKSNLWDKESLLSSADLYKTSANKRININDYPKALDNLIKAARILKIIGENAKSENLFKLVFNISNKKNINNTKIISLGELAIIDLGNGKFAPGKEKLKEIKKLSRNSSNSSLLAFIYFVESEYAYYERDIPNCIKLLKTSLKIVEEENIPKDEVKYLQNLAYAYMAIDENKKGLDTLEKALEISKSINDNREIAITLTALGYAYSNNNEKQKSLESYKEAQYLFPQDIDLIDKARVYNGIGRNFEELGEWKLSLENRKKAFEIFGKANHKFGQSSTIPYIAVLTSLIYPNDKDLVLESFQDAFQFTKSVKDKFHTAFVTKELADYYFRLSDYDIALKYYKNSLSYFQELKGIRNTSLIKTKISQIHIANGDLREARHGLLEALNESKSIKNNLSSAEIIFYLAKLEHLEEKDKESLKYILESIEMTESLYSHLVNSRLRQTYFSNSYEKYEFLIKLLMEMQNKEPLRQGSKMAFLASEKLRARSMLEKLALSEVNLTRDADPEITKREKEVLSLLNIKSDKLINLLSQNRHKIDIDEITNEIGDFENQLEEIRAELKQKSPVYSALKNPEPFDLEDFQQDILDDNSILLEFSLGNEESYLWLVSKNELSHVILPSRKHIEERIERIHQTFESRQPSQNEDIETYQKRLQAAEDSYNQEISLLSKEILEPIAEKIANKRLIIVPDGKLALLPFALLINPLTNESLIKHNEIVYEPSATFLSFLTKLGNKSNPPQKDLLVLADPVFSDDDARLSNKPKSEVYSPGFMSLNFRDFTLMDENGKISRLFESQGEAESITKIVGTAQTSIISGFEANRERVLNSDLSNYKILHFATHGLVDVKRPEISSIVLSQFDIDGNKNENFIRLQDIYALNLNTDLVVLSSCESGVGKEIRGEGLLSINNAFLQAGAKSVLSSTWRVDDRATAELMKLFYQELVDKKIPPSEALRQAQIKMSENPQYSSPFYWAAFTVHGDFRNSVAIEKSFKSYYIFNGVAGILLTLFTVYLLKRKLHLLKS